MENKKKLFVGNLPFSITEEELQNFFAEVGAVTSVKIPLDSMSGRSRGFGFIEMESPKDAQKAIDELNEAEFKGRKISVSIAREREKERMPSDRKGSFNKRRD
ncbi:MAG: RNA-binding protein [Candidatus Doudnabacteria bacterium]|nr:RNA-binding protein [Candidatus Doudnabacteria bacterium]